MSCGCHARGQDAVKAWGVRQLTLLEAEDRLSVVTEKGVTQDPVILKLREVYQVRAGHACTCARGTCRCALGMRTRAPGVHAGARWACGGVSTAWPRASSWCEHVFRS